MAKRIKDDSDKYCPSLNEETNSVEEITLIEIELQILKEEIEEINKKDFKESFQNIKEEIINEAIKKKHGKIKEIKEARTLDILLEMEENIPKEIKKMNSGRPKKEKDKNSGREYKTIEDMFKEENKTINTNNIMDLC